MRLLAEPVKSARKIRQEARLKAQAEKMEKKLGLTPLTPGKVKKEIPNKGSKSKSLVPLLIYFNKQSVRSKFINSFRFSHQCFIQNRASGLLQLTTSTTQTCQCWKVPTTQESTQHLQPEHQQLPHSGCRGHPTERGHLSQPPWPSWPPVWTEWLSSKL